MSFGGRPINAISTSWLFKLGNRLGPVADRELDGDVRMFLPECRHQLRCKIFGCRDNAQCQTADAQPFDCVDLIIEQSQPFLDHLRRVEKSQTGDGRPQTLVRSVEQDDVCVFFDELELDRYRRWRQAKRVRRRGDCAVLS